MAKKKLDSIKKPASSLAQPPDIPPGEDEHSFSRFNGMLKAEARKAKPNRDVVSKLMERAYSQRRNHILTTPMPLSQLLQQYPFLGREDEVHLGVVIDYSNASFPVAATIPFSWKRG